MLKIVGMLSVFNDEDIVEEVIKYYLSQGIELVILDNFSTDNTFQICKKFSKKEKVKLSRIKMKFETILYKRVFYDIALVQSPDWIIRIASDEFLESGENNLTLKDAILKIDEKGYNLIQFDRFDFFMTDKDDESVKSIKEKLPYYSFQNDFVYRAWKYIPGIRLNFPGEHLPIFPEFKGYNIYLKKFVMRHYPFRSKEQSEKRMKDRIKTVPNILKPKEKKHRYQLILEKDFSSKINHKLLTKYEENNVWNYIPKFTPYTLAAPKHEDVFSDKGELKIKESFQGKLMKELRQKDAQIHELKKKLKDIERQNSNKYDE